MTDLIICEKPNVAKKIANALGNPKKKSDNGVPYYELERNGKKIIVASAVGHLFTLEEVKTDKKKKFGEYPVFDIRWAPASTIKGKEYVQKYINTLKKLAKEADEFYIASDWDIEGELIGYHALYYCCGKKDAKRMRFSSLTKNEIVKAYENPDKIDFGLVDAGDSRHKVDWYYGINVSRALMQSIRAVNRWQTMSTGRVQGPALSFLVDRELEIRKFVPTPYWVIGALLKDEITAIHEKDKFWDEKEANEIYNKIKGEKEAVVSSVKKTKKKIKPNPPFDLGTLQREAHRAFRFSPKKTQEIAQKLYEQGLCLHPDTLVALPNGIKKIKDLDEKGEVLCLDDDLKLTKSRYKLLKRTVKEKLIKITLNDGTELITTKEHPVLVYRDGLIFVPSEELKENEQTIMFINISEKRFNSKLQKSKIFESSRKTKFIDFILENLNGDKDYILIEPSLTKKIQKLIASDKSRKQIMEIFGIKEPTYYKYLRTGKIPIKIIKYLIDKDVISKKDIESNYLGFCYGTSTIPVNIEFTNDFWYLYGYVIGDGHLANKGKITIPAKDRSREKEIINAIIQSCESLNLNWRYDKYKVIHISSKSLTRIFEVLGCPYGNKTEIFDIPNIVFEDVNYIASLLAGYYDADGHFSIKKTGCNNNSPQIKLTSKNINVLRKIKNILQFLGIGGYIWTKRNNTGEIEGHDLNIYSKDAGKFYDLMINHIRVKRDELQKVKELSIRDYKKYSHHYSIIYANWENKFKSGIIQKFNLSNQVSKNKGLSLNKLRELSEYLTDNDLKRISKGDVYISKIKEIKEIEYEGEVYDLTVETYHNFIANGVIVHNCSYPRTSSQKLPKDENYIKDILTKILKHGDYKKYAELILNENRKPIEGKKSDPAHPAIHFVDIPKEPLADDEKKLYDLIVRRTLATFWDDAEREYINVVLNIGGENFKLSGSRTVKEGWHEIYYFTKFDEKELPSLRKNNKIPVEKITIERKETKPPKRYTMASIIKELENRQLGTKCLTSDTLIKVKINDKIENLKIGELFEMLNEKFCKNNVEFATNNNKIKCISYNENGNIVESEFEFISRRKLCDNERVYKIEFNDGSYIEATDEHPILIYDNKEHIKYVRTKDLDKGMKCIYSIKYSDKEGKIFCNWDEFVEKCNEKSKLYGLTDEVKDLREKLNLSKHKFSERFGISYTQTWKYEENKRVPLYLFNRLGLKKPKYITSTNPKLSIKNPFPLGYSSSLIRIISHLVGDGSIYKKGITKENVYDFRYHNTDMDLITQFVDDVENVFGIRLTVKKAKPKLVKNKTRYCKEKYYVQIPAVVGRVLAILFPEIVNKNAPKFPKEFYPEYIGALFDDEGCVVENECKLFISNTNFDLLEDIKKMLLELGIESRLDKNQFKLYIKGRKNTQKFLNKIPFISVDKKQKLINALSNKYAGSDEKNSIVWKEKSIIAALGHNEMGLTSKEIRDIANISDSIIGDYLRELINNGIVEKITVGISEYPRKKIIYKCKLNPNDLFYKYIGEKVINKDFITKTISNIEIIDYNGYVYDIVNSKYSNFIANGIVVHNSTRADIVEKLVKRGYLIDDGSLKVTDLGIAVIETLKKYCPEIIDEQMTRELEKKLDRLQKGTIKKETVLKDAENKLRAILEEVKKKEKEIGKELVEKIDATNKSLKTVGKCECGGDLIIIRTKGKKRFIGCTNYPECTKTYPLPQKGRIKVLNETCEVCGAPVISIDKQKVCINPECPSKISSEEKKEIEKAEKAEKTCPKCGGKLIIKKGIYGVFLGCENYPKCRYTEKLNGKNEAEKHEKVIVGKCPDCGGDLIIRKGRFGEFIGCSNYPKCRHTEKIKKNDDNKEKKGKKEKEENKK
ncbi:DNA topoisomerase I [Methanothermococcus sp. Ax23]|uniref:DNA topoisomerase I n=1 Tax=Methanothermococcus sp. Ax23 TaxID=3156486 RepID=UPI003B9E73CE